MAIKKHHIHYTFWSAVAIGVGVGVPWFFLGGVHKVSAFLIQKNANQLQFENNEIAYLNQAIIGEEITASPIDNYFVDASLEGIDAKSYLIGDIETGEIILEKNADTVYPIASISKLMTAIVAQENLAMTDTAIVSRNATRVESARGGLIAGEQLRIIDLMYPLLLVSSNDAAQVLSENYNYEKFVTLMNTKASELKLDKTSFADPSGLSEQNVSTARNLFALLQNIRTNYPEIVNITTTDNYKIKSHSWQNINKLKDTFEFRGGKTGYTSAARYTSAAYYSVPVSGTNRFIAVIILQSDDRTNDIEKILNFVQKNVRYSGN